MMRLRRTIPVAGILLLVASGAACSDAGDTEARAPLARVVEQASAGNAETNAASLAIRAAPVDRKVVYTAELTVRAANVPTATARAIAATRAAGGHLFSQEADSQGRKETLLTLKVPSDRFDSVLASIARLGRVQHRSVRARDVTAEVVDVEARLKTAQASLDRLRALLAGAKTTTDLVEVERALAERESESESLQGRLRVLSDQVDLATIDVRLIARDEPEDRDELPGFRGGLRSGWGAIVNTAQVALVALGFALPFAPFAALATWLVRFVRRRARKRAVLSGVSEGEPPPLTN